MAKPKPLRVLLAISEERMPDWYACLDSIDSGHVRAELIRAALRQIDPAKIQLVRQSRQPSPQTMTQPSDPPGLGTVSDGTGCEAVDALESGRIGKAADAIVPGAGPDAGPVNAPQAPAPITRYGEVSRAVNKGEGMGQNGVENGAENRVDQGLKAPSAVHSGAAGEGMAARMILGGSAPRWL